MIDELSSLATLVPGESATVPLVFAARAARSPDVTFLIDQGRRWRYSEATREMLSVADLLARACEGKPRPRVATFLGNTAAAMWTWLATMSLGGIYLAVNRHHRGAVLFDMLKRARYDVLVTNSAAFADLPDLSNLGAVPIILTDDQRPVVAFPNVRFTFFDRRPVAATAMIADLKASDVAAVFFTSGTTGRSKAVQVPHYQLCRGAGRLVEAFGLREGDVFHNWLPLYHLAGILHMTMTAIIAGGSVALFPTFSRTRFWGEVRDTGATVICGFTTILHWLLVEPESTQDAENSLRVGIIAGIPADLHRRFEQRFGLTIHEQYGMTEADPMTIPDPARPTPLGSSGPESPDFEIAILDEDDHPVPVGQIGQIVVRPRVADIMTSGYEDDPKATVDSWRNLWFHTGDLGRLDQDGFLYFSGRSKDAIRRRGENISAMEIERVVQTCEGVAECAALGVPSPLGEEEVKVVVVPLPGCSIDPARLHVECGARMARFMVPRYIEIVTALPKTNLGKVQKDLLKPPGPTIWDAQTAAKPLSPTTAGDQA